MLDNPYMPRYKWFHGEVMGKSLTLYPRRANMLLRCDVNGSMKGMRIRISKQEDWYRKGRLHKENHFLYLEKTYSLSRFIHTIVSQPEGYETPRADSFKEKQYRADGFSGQRIWNYVKGALEEEPI